MTRMRVLHREVEPKTPVASENRQISGSPPGVPSPDSLPSEIKILQQRRVSNCADKAAGNGNTGHCERSASRARGNLNGRRRLLRRNERSSQ